jgi:RNA polymerase sigma factor (sigma-70 family)
MLPVQKSMLSDNDLIHKIRQNDEQALRLAYQVNYNPIAHFILNNNGTEAEAKDIYQEAFMVFYEKLKDLSFQLNCQIKTFLYSISRRLWLKRLAEKKHFLGKINDFEEFLVLDNENSESDETEKQLASMQNSITELGEPCQTLLLDYYYRQMTMQEIAEKFGYTNADNAKNQKYKCLQRLKKLFFKAYQTS